MKKIFLLIIFILTTTCFISAQENYTDSTNPVVSEQEKSNAQNFIGSVDKIVRELKNSSVGKASDMFASFTTLLICIGAVIIIITKTMKAMHKGEVIDLNSILLPFILALVVSAYKPLTHSVDWCVQGFDAIMAGMSYSTLDEIEIKREKAVLLNDFNKKSPQRRFLRGQLQYMDGKQCVYITQVKSGNGILSSTLNSNCIIELEAGNAGVSQGTMVDIIKF